jgi:hypothetical protein
MVFDMEDGRIEEEKMVESKKRKKELWKKIVLRLRFVEIKRNSRKKSFGYVT